MRDLRDKVAVITGAASGIGRATAEALARAGCEVALVDLDAPRMQETAEQVRAAGRRASMHEVDVSDKIAMERLVAAVSQEHGHVHVLVNNAGVTTRGTLAEHTLEDFEWVIGINFLGVVYGCKLFLPLLLREPQSHIVNISSMAGLIGLPTQTSYCASKFAVRGFSEALWTELRDSNVGVTCVFPGAVSTNIVSSARVYDREGDEPLDRSMERLLSPAMPPERVARKIVRGIQRNRLRLVIRPEAHVSAWATRLFPGLTQRLVAWAYGRARRA